MDKEKARSLLVDYIYDELDEQEKKSLEKLLANDEDLRRELRELKETRGILRYAPDVNPSLKPFYLAQPETSETDSVATGPVGAGSSSAGPVGAGSTAAGSTESESQYDTVQSRIRLLMPRTWAGTFAAGMAALLLIGFLAISIAGIQVQVTEQGWSVAFGIQQPAEQQVVDEEMLDVLIDRIREENLLITSTLLEESERQQQELLNDTVESILLYMEQQRLNDLQLVHQGLAELEEDNVQRYLWTNEMLGDLIYAIQYQE